jgi:DNA-binding MarR family transcriptional regulator
MPTSVRLVTSHAEVMVYVARHPDATINVISHQLGITERRVSGILRDLSGAGFVQVKRVGRRNHYEVNLQTGLRDLIGRGWSTALLTTVDNPPRG